MEFSIGASIELNQNSFRFFGALIMMTVFGLGAALPIVILGLLSRQAMLQAKIKLQGVGGIGKTLLGIFF
jgi:cytochrome c biogenesis protein CcdA